ncbi:hypothetical protein KHP60_09845 [Microvirga sp. 3-52]|uniref:hypothetical protein n=1 Tax=Microvirga sp. 3-52 TaxID=2792425 RepID=UPI001AC5042B|nr:hypothetical protein [Microvirga sp. 3-52]MBO1905274.1 hypothetical protein [Microvirga sp. 3-52]MBS7452637.1 hypothetical protein [Microvirga sp. 3-52]
MSPRPATRLLVAVGLLTVGTGLYLMVLRPPLLPEDVRFAGLDPLASPPALLGWLAIVFRTWGAFVVGFGFSLTGCGVSLATGRPVWLRYGVALALSVSFGQFLLSNWMLRSDFLWPIVALFLVALATAVGRIAAREGR